MSAHITPDLCERLVATAREAASSAYCPYSGFRVGAAVLVDGKVYCGCNIENASYGLTICAERVAIFHARARGNLKHIQVLAVACPDAPPDGPLEQRMSCGACRQVIAEFSGPETGVIIDGIGHFLIWDLLPRPFSLSTPPKMPAF
jgi:cytidine deaminase